MNHIIHYTSVENDGAQIGTSLGMKFTQEYVVILEGYDNDHELQKAIDDHTVCGFRLSKIHVIGGDLSTLPTERVLISTD